MVDTALKAAEAMLNNRYYFKANTKVKRSNNNEICLYVKGEIICKRDLLLNIISFKLPERPNNTILNRVNALLYKFNILKQVRISGRPRRTWVWKDTSQVIEPGKWIDIQF